MRRRNIVFATLVALGLPLAAPGLERLVHAATPVHRSSKPLVINVPQAVGGKTVTGQLTVDNTTGPGFVTAYPCADGLPRNAAGDIAKSDLNYNGAINPIASNRLVAKADASGNLCFYTSAPANFIVDIDGITEAFAAQPNQRTDTRTAGGPAHNAANPLQVHAPQAVGGKTVIGQLTVDKTTSPGFVTAYPCADGPPKDANGNINKSDLNYNGAVNPIASNRLISKADSNGNICFHTSQPADFIIDIDATTDSVTTKDNQRVDTRTGTISSGKKVSTISFTVPEAVGGKTVVGQLTVDGATSAGFVTAYPCADGLPKDSDGNISKSDLNFNGAINPIASNRLVAKADANGKLCLYASQQVHLIVDISATTTQVTSQTNQRTDTRPVEAPPSSGGGSGSGPGSGSGSPGCTVSNGKITCTTG